MKKILVVLLSVLLLAGCTAKDTPTTNNNTGNGEVNVVELYEKGFNDLAKADSFHMRMNMDTPEAKIVMEILVKENNNNPMMYMDMRAGETLDQMESMMKMYLVDKISYIDFMGEKVKTDASSEIEAIMDQYKGSQVTSSLPTTVNEKDFSTDSEGNYVYTLPQSELNSVNSLVGDELGASGVDTASASVKDAKIIMSPEGQIKSINMEMETQGVAMTLVMEYVAIGESVVIDLPDFSDYKEVSL